jgi:rhodanese-related sulfurtransferase
MKINLKTVLLLVGILLIVSVPSALAHTDVTAEQARELIDSTDDLIVVDVREPHEYHGTGGHIPGALNYPFNSGVLQAQYEELPIDGPILVVCRSGGRSNRAANFLDSIVFSMVYDMLGGMSAWIWETEISDDPDSKYGGGTGEPNDPYQIATFEDLMLLGKTPEDYDKHFILTADIDLDPNLPSRKVFDKAVIAPENIYDDPEVFGGTSFSGHFDGNGYVISNLKIQGSRYLGLFGLLENGAVISNLGLKAVDVNGTDRHIGGLVGYNSGSEIFECYSSGLVSGGADVGGLTGYNSTNGSILSSHNTSIVIGEGFHIGGLVGFNFGQIFSSYSTSTVAGEKWHVGGLVGENNGYVLHSFWDKETSGQDTSAGGIGKTTVEMQTANTFLGAGWDFVGETDNGTEDIWSICEGTNYPRFLWQIQVGDFICPDGIDRDDFFFLLEFWLNDNCDSSNDFCQGTDLDQSGTVDENDLDIFFESWLAEE